MIRMRSFLLILLALGVLGCPTKEEEGDPNGFLQYLYVLYLDGGFNPKEYFCRNVNGSIANDQEVTTNEGLGIKKGPGPNGTNIELTLLDSSGCHLRALLYYCDFFDNAFLYPPSGSGTCNIGGTVIGSGNQLNCTIYPSSYYRYALRVIPEDSSNLYSSCSYSIKVTDF